MPLKVSHCRRARECSAKVGANQRSDPPLQSNADFSKANWSELLLSSTASWSLQLNVTRPHLFSQLFPQKHSPNFCTRNKIQKLSGHFLHDVLPFVTLSYEPVSHGPGFMGRVPWGRVSWAHVPWARVQWSRVPRGSTRESGRAPLFLVPYIRDPPSRDHNNADGIARSWVFISSAKISPELHRIPWLFLPE